MASPPAASGIDPGSGRYVVAAADVAAFARDGYVHLPQVLTAAELAAFEPWYTKFLTGELRPEGKDLCDMSGAVDRTPDQYTVYNAMLPRRYSKEFLAQSQLYAERCVAGPEGSRAAPTDRSLPYRSRPPTTAEPPD